MVKGRRKIIKEQEKPISISVDGKPFSLPESFGEAWGSLFEDNASIDFPARLAKNPLLNQNYKLSYQQIDKGILPFNYDSSSNYIDIKTIVELCQKAYFNVSIFKNTIDTMTEFSNSEIFFKGGNEKSRKLFASWWNKIGGYSLADKWFREWYRSGNEFVYRFDADIDTNILSKMGQVYGAETAIKSPKLPIRYVIMNPACISVGNGISFIDTVYYYKLSSYECLRIRKPITEEDLEFRKSLPPDVIKQIDSGSTSVMLPLDPSKTYCVFCKKQDYEPFAVPTFFPVLSDLDLKLTFKSVEKVLARTVEYVTLQIKIGTEENPNYPAMEAMKELMRNETLGRILVTSYDTSMEFIIPDINKVLGSEKYKQVNEDISNGLMDIFSASEKFSSTSLKVQIFVEKLKEARRAFLENFLNPEIKRIAQNLGLKSFPRAGMADLDIANENLFQKIIVQLGQLGILTGPEVIEAIQTSYLPTKEESLEEQKEFKKLRDEGLYEPLTGNSQNAEEGRPGGSTGIKQQTKKVGPVGTSKSSIIETVQYFDINKIAEVLKETNKIYNSLEKEAKKHFKVRTLNEIQKSAIHDLMPIILANEQKENWEKSAIEYIKNPKIINQEIGIKIDEIMSKYDVSTFLASVLIHCEK